MTKGEECAELLQVSQSKVELLEGVIENDKKIQLGLEAQLLLMDKQVALRIVDNTILEGEVRRYKKRSAGTIILSSIIVGFTLFLAVK